MRLLGVAVLLFMLQGARNQPDAVVKRASVYVDGYMKDLGSIVGEERYYQEARWEDRDMDRKRLRSRRGRQLVSDILTVPVGKEWIGIRHVREVDGITLDPQYRGFWRETFDESTADGREKLQQAFTFESTRYNIGDFRRSTNLPTFPLEILDSENLDLFNFSKQGEERIGTVRTWKFDFNDRSRRTLLMTTGIGRPERFSISGTFWIEPSTGQVFRAVMNFESPFNDELEMRMDVRYRIEPTLGVLVPQAMDEFYRDDGLRHEVEGHADYASFRRFNSDVRLDPSVTDDDGPREEPGLSRDSAESYSMKVDVRVVNVEAWVTSTSGTAVTDLKASNFRIFENKTAQTITNFSPVSTPYDVLLLFDRSGSTQHDWKFMQRAADGFIKGLRQQDRAGIANFDTSFRMETRWSDSRQQIAAAVAGLTDGKRPGGTAFYRAVEVSLAAELLPIAGRRRALIVLTDGRDNGLYLPLLRQGELPRPQQESAFQQMIDLAKRERVPIYIVTVSNSANEVATLRNRYSEAVANQYLDAVAVRMEQLAEVTGGRVLFPKRLDDIVPLYSQISRELGSAYSIGYVSNLPLSVHGFRDIEVRTTDNRLHVVQSRSGYVVQ